MEEEYFSCDYLESGLSFSYNSIRACAIVHHDTGEPVLADYAGGSLPVDEILLARAEIIRQNQGQTRHPNCRNCPCLVYQKWPRSSYPIQWLGITSWLGCNLKCSYCWLQWAEWSPRNITTKIPLALYDVSDSIHQLIESGLLAPTATIDWGGGGEPLLMPGFDEMLTLLNEYGTTQWIHTNGVVLPQAVRERTIDCSRMRILCSVDAGSQKTYESIKGRNLYDVVWANLKAYTVAGAKVSIKYLVMDENSSYKELRGFVQKALDTGQVTVIGDIDHRFPDPTPKILKALAYLQLLVHKHGLDYGLGGTGLNSVTEIDLNAYIEQQFPSVYNERFLYPEKTLKQRFVETLLRCRRLIF
ncbi:MAG: radical SAM protein [Cyanobacteria bacterium P01_F01_bin.13]